MSFSIYAVDDTEAIRKLLEKSLGKHYEIETFEAAVDCLQALGEKMPDMFLLDVNMPGMDGYELCRQIRARPDGQEASVIFVSGRDDMESRLIAYDAGGDDFIIKPFEIKEVERKIAALFRLINEKSELKTRVDDADMLTSLVMSNLDEYAILVKFLRSLNGCESYRDVAEATMEMIRGYHLEGALQFRLPHFEITLSHAGDVSPLEASVINHLRTTDTIVQFKTRSAYNFDRVSLLVSNMPVNDPDLCGRLRDHLAIAAETVNMRLEAMIIRDENNQTREGIMQLLKTLFATVHDFKTHYDSARYRGSLTTQTMLTQLSNALAPLALTESQEESIIDSVRGKVYELIDIFDFGETTERELKKVTDKLAAMVGDKT